MRLCVYVCLINSSPTHLLISKGDTLTGVVTRPHACRPRNLGSISDMGQQICFSKRLNWR
jgi:hypothetical protein